MAEAHLKPHAHLHREPDREHAPGVLARGLQREEERHVAPRHLAQRVVGQQREGHHRDEAEAPADWTRFVNVKLRGRNQRTGSGFGNHVPSGALAADGFESTQLRAFVLS